MVPFTSTDVCLVNMPFSSISYPSAALGILDACLTKHNITSKTFHFNLDFAEIIGPRLFNLMSELPQQLLMGEWIFRKLSFPEFLSNDEEYFGLFSTEYPLLKKTLIQMQSVAETFLQKVVEEILVNEPRIVGCSSNFQQHCASLAVLRRIKEQNPKIYTVLGGSNCEGQAAKVIVSHFKWIDYVCYGEAEVSFPELCKKLLFSSERISESSIPDGFISRENFSSALKKGLFSQTYKFSNWDIIPNYDEYFSRLKRHEIAKQITPILVTESSRGCWWGQKIKCAFCGLEDETVKFRQKEPNKFCDEIECLNKKYKIKKFRLLDNSVSLTTLKHMSDRFYNKGYLFICDIKVNISKEMISRISSAGIKTVQVGVESLCDEVLKMVNKGASTLLNIQFLKWATFYGIEPVWNFLVAFPGEQELWYQNVIELIPKISHLHPPTGLFPVKYYRFSDYFSKQNFYKLCLQPETAYHFVYPLDKHGLYDIAYYFKNTNLNAENSNHSSLRPTTYQTLQTLVDNWIEDFSKQGAQKLQMVKGSNNCFVVDCRQSGKQKNIPIDYLQSKILELSDKVISLHEIEQVYHSNPNHLHDAIDFLIKHNLLLMEKDRILSLVIYTDSGKEY